MKSPDELTARVQVVLRRFTQPAESFRLGDLTIDDEGRRVTVAGSPLDLTATEFDLIRVLSVNAGRVVTYNSLMRQVWHRRKHGSTQLVRTYVKRLRHKFGDDADDPVYIATERGVGYRMPRPGNP